MERARLEYTDNSGKRCVVPVDDDPFLIGRSTSNHLALQSAEVSREHAVITSNDGQFTIEDRKSRAGTFLNGQQISEHTLASGDCIRVGPTIELRFSVGADHATGTSDSETSSTSTAITDLRQTAALLEGLRAMGSARVLDHVLDLVLDSAIDVSGAERGFLMLVSDSGTLEFEAGPTARPAVALDRRLRHQPQDSRGGLHDRRNAAGRGPARLRHRVGARRHDRPRDTQRLVCPADRGAVGRER